MAHKNASDLQDLGRKAAEGFSNKKYATLTTAVLNTVKQAGLTPMQVQRVVEFANKEAYAAQHSSKLAQAERNIEFSGGPARATDVLEQLNSVPHRRIEPSYDDYKSAPAKTASTAEENDAYFRELFKTAAPVLTDGELQPFFHIEKLADELAHQLREADSLISRCESAYEQTRYELGELAKEAQADNITLGQMVQAWSVFDPPPGLIKKAFEDLTPMLLPRHQWGESAKFASELSQVGPSGALVDMEHPLVQGFAKYAQSLIELEATKKVADDLQHHLQETRSFIKQAAELPRLVKEAGCSGADCKDKSCKEHGREKKEASSRLDLDELIKGASFLDSAKQFGKNIMGQGAKSKAELDAMRYAADRMPQNGNLIHDRIKKLEQKNRELQQQAFRQAGTVAAPVAAAGGLGAAALALRNRNRSEEEKQASVDTRGWISKARDAVNAAAGHVGRGASAVATPFFDQGSAMPGHLGTAARVAVQAAPVVGAGLVGLKALKHIEAAGATPAGRAIKSFIPGTQEYDEDTLRTQMAWGAQQPQFY